VYGTLQRATDERERCFGFSTLEWLREEGRHAMKNATGETSLEVKMGIPAYIRASRRFGGRPAGLIMGNVVLIYKHVLHIVSRCRRSELDVWDHANCPIYNRLAWVC